MERISRDKIGKVLGMMTESSRNSTLSREDSQAVENFIVSLCLSCFYPRCSQSLEKYPDGGINSGSFKHLIPDHIVQQYPFPSDLWVPSGVPSSLWEWTRQGGVDFVGALYEDLQNRRSNGRMRKREGVFYTPRWLVEDMVANTLKPMLKVWYDKFSSALEQCDPYGFICLFDQLGYFKILDPACGWGVFLTEAYIELGQFYGTIGTMASAVLQRCALDHFDISDMFSDDYAGVLEESQLLSQIKKTCQNPAGRILGQHLYGMDIDPDSATMAASLLGALAGVEGGSDLGVACGDFISWMEKPGKKFDLVIGNPPYFTIGGGGKGRDRGDYHRAIKSHPFFGSHFRAQSDIFYYFITGGIDRLKDGGIISYVVPSYWLENQMGDLLRGYILDNCHIQEAVRFCPLPVFSTIEGREVAVDAMTFAGVKKEQDHKKNNHRESPVLKAYSPDPSARFSSAQDFLSCVRSGDSGVKPVHIDTSRLAHGRWDLSGETAPQVLVIDGEDIHPLGDITSALSKSLPDRFTGESPYSGPCRMGQGQETGLSSVFVVSSREAQRLGLEEELLVPNIKNSHVRRYYLKPDDTMIIMMMDHHQPQEYPRVMNYLKEHRSGLEARQRVATGQRKWFAVSIPQNMKLFSATSKILVPYRATRCRFAMDRRGYFNDGGDVRAIIVKDEWAGRVSLQYLLGFLNSRFVGEWFARHGKRKGKMLEFFTRSLSLIPFREPDDSTRRQVEELSRRLEEIYASCECCEDPSALEIEKMIDRLIFDLYRMSDGFE